MMRALAFVVLVSTLSVGAACSDSTEVLLADASVSTDGGSSAVDGSALPLDDAGDSGAASPLPVLGTLQLKQAGGNPTTMALGTFAVNDRFTLEITASATASGATLSKSMPSNQWSCAAPKVSVALGDAFASRVNATSCSTSNANVDDDSKATGALPLSTRLTVARPTLARFATSRMVGPFEADLLMESG
mgnify:CR=1 FL=1